ncbi:hypothetical protein ACFE04_007070 [Oxalis oulophora]
MEDNKRSSVEEPSVLVKNKNSAGSNDELIMQYRRRVAPETIRVCNGLSAHQKAVVLDDKKRNREEEEDEDEEEEGGRVEEGVSDVKRNKLDVFEFDEYDDLDLMKGKAKANFSDIGVKRLTDVARKYEAGGSSRHMEKRTKLRFDRNSHFGHSEDEEQEPIRFGGKYGVLKVAVNNKKKLGGASSKGFDNNEAKESGRRSKVGDTVKRNSMLRPSFNSDTKSVEKSPSFSETQKSKSKSNLKKSLPPTDEGSDSGSEDSDTSFKIRSKKVKLRDSDSVNRLTPKRNSKVSDNNSEDSDSRLKLGPRACSSKRKISDGSFKTPTGLHTSSKIKEGKVKRGSGTEKQKLREKIKEMLLSAGWTIDYRPRRNKDYLDAVYINPTGTGFWSINKAYEALQKQLAVEESATFDSLSDEILNQLTRKTQQKIEKEMKMKKGSTAKRRSSSVELDEETSDNDSQDDKLSTFMEQCRKSIKARANGNSSFGVNLKNQSSGDEKPSKSVQGRKSRKLGRCTLLVRAGTNSETDGFVPNDGKLTVLSWLIDSGTVQLNQKVQYMNRQQTRVMLDGWITRDGINCGCCSKFVTVWNFELHAGSKLRQPFQNIFLDTGISLLQCQIDAWNRQELSEHIGFCHVDNDDDGDPNDDTCGICGDGGNLICCDGCPSTFHQSCLNIQVLPPGDWHCPNCTCKFCGVAIEDVAEGGDNSSVHAMFNCTLCEKQYHKSCVLDTVDLNCSIPFCGKKCKELFEHLQRQLGVKQELEAGFSWSLLHRIDGDASKQELSERVENNAKLAVALAVLDECFLPVIDRRSGINVIKNVLYNCRSNFRRLNYTSFYTAVLERGDEIISAASIRFHGTQLAEMPFIGTRHVYRRQGMCRRLLSAIETALCSLNVEKLVIPAIPELANTWTSVFGFTSLKGASKQDMRSLNMLVFPGIDMMHKLLVKKESKSVSEGTKDMEINSENGVTLKIENQSDENSSAEHEAKECDEGNLCIENEITGEVTTMVSGSKRLVVSLNNIVTSDYIEGSGEEKTLVAGKRAAKKSVDDNLCVESELNSEITTTVSDSKCTVFPSNDNLTANDDKLCVENEINDDNLGSDSGEENTGEGTAKKCDDNTLSVENDINGVATPTVSDCKGLIVSSNDNLTTDGMEGFEEKIIPVTCEGTVKECDDDKLCVENEIKGEVTSTVPNFNLTDVSSDHSSLV